MGRTRRGIVASTLPSLIVVAGAQSHSSRFPLVESKGLGFMVKRRMASVMAAFSGPDSRATQIRSFSDPSPRTLGEAARSLSVVVTAFRFRYGIEAPGSGHKGLHLSEHGIA